MNLPTIATAKVHRWNELTADAPMNLLSRRRIMGDKAMLSHVTLKRGCFVPSHSHENEQFACILSGKLKFGIGAVGSRDFKEVTVSAGEVMHLPSNVLHSAEAVEDTVVIDVFSPPSATTGVDRKP